jgi:hypothetical protein
VELGRFTDAEADLVAAESVLIKHHPPDHVNVVEARSWLAEVFERQSRDADASRWRALLDQTTQPPATADDGQR